MAKVLTGISGNLISAASAGFAPTNSADVSAIASAYQVVSATATQLYAGTAYVTSVNGAPLSASRAGNAANASLANSAWYDGTGRLISSLPDSAAVSAIASAYAESAASSKQDELTFSYDDDKISAINGSALAGQGGGGGSVASPSGTIIVTDGTAIEATNSAVYISPPGPLSVYTSAHPSVASSRYYGGTIYTCDYGSGMPAEGIDVYMAKIPNAYTGSASFTAYNTSWEEAWTGRTSWNSANNKAELRFGTLIDVVSLSWGDLGGGNAYLSGSSTSNYSIQFLKSTQSSVAVGELAWASSLPTYGYDGNSAISSINGSAIAAGNTMAYVEKSAWSVEIGYNNTATMTSFAQGERNSSDGASFVQGLLGYASNESFGQGSKNSAANISFSQGYRNTANLTSFAQGADNSALTLSFAAGTHNYAMNHSFAAGYYNSAANSATAFGQYNLKNDGATTGHSAAFVIGDGTASDARHDLMVVTKDGEITMYSSTADTVGTGIMSSIRAISAAATGGGGGVDSATVSAIASSYAESAASSKVDLYNVDTVKITAKGLAFSGASGITARYGNSMAVLQTYPLQRMYLTDQGTNKGVYTYPSGISGNGGGNWQYGTAEYGKLTSVYDTVSGNSATWGAGGVDSAACSAIASSYAESAVSSKADNSALSSYALSADVSGTVDLVSTQSANWGGSALALSAGPGVKLEKVGDTLVASTDETVLWSGTPITVAAAITGLPLTESPYNFERVALYWVPWGYADINSTQKQEAVAEARITSAIPRIGSVTEWNAEDSNTVFMFVLNAYFDSSKFYTQAIRYFSLGDWTINIQGDGSYITKIVGINRTAGV